MLSKVSEFCQSIYFVVSNTASFFDSKSEIKTVKNGQIKKLR